MNDFRCWTMLGHSREFTGSEKTMLHIYTLRYLKDILTVRDMFNIGLYSQHQRSEHDTCKGISMGDCCSAVTHCNTRLMSPTQVHQSHHTVLYVSDHIIFRTDVSMIFYKYLMGLCTCNATNVVGIKCTETGR
jgi:hypothetical protein